MSNDPLSKLTDRQRECLLLASRHMETKEIARALGISPSAVEQRIRGAVQRLGVSNRREAIRLVAAGTDPATYGKTTYGSPELAGQDASPAVDAAAGGESVHDVPLVREEQMPFEPDAPNALPLKLPFPTSGRIYNDLGVLQRLGWILVIAVISALALGGLVAGIFAGLNAYEHRLG